MYRTQIIWVSVNDFNFSHFYSRLKLQIVLSSTSIDNVFLLNFRIICVCPGPKVLIVLSSIKKNNCFCRRALLKMFLSRSCLHWYPQTQVLIILSLTKILNVSVKELVCFLSWIPIKQDYALNLTYKFYWIDPLYIIILFSIQIIHGTVSTLIINDSVLDPGYQY